MSIILRQFPYPSHWTRVCSSILFIFNIILSLVFGTIYLLRWTIFFKTTLRDVHKDTEEIALQACPAITWLTLTVQVQLTAAQSWGYGFTILAFAMWWIALLWMLFILTTLYIHLVKYPSRRQVDSWLPTAVFVPVVGLLTVVNTAGVIVNGAVNDTHLGDTLGVPIIVVGFMCVGFAVGIGLVMYSIYMHRLMVSGWPAPLKIPAMILTVSTFPPQWAMPNIHRSDHVAKPLQPSYSLATLPFFTRTSRSTHKGISSPPRLQARFASSASYPPCSLLDSLSSGWWWIITPFSKAYFTTRSIQACSGGQVSSRSELL